MPLDHVPIIVKKEYEECDRVGPLSDPVILVRHDHTIHPHMCSRVPQVRGPETLVIGRVVLFSIILAPHLERVHAIEGLEQFAGAIDIVPARLNMMVARFRRPPEPVLCI